MTFASGSPFFMRRALERRFEPALVIDDPWPRWFLGAKSLATTATVGRFHADWSPRLTALAGARTVARVRAARPDIVFALMASPLAHLLVDEFRVVHASDTTLHAMFGYYNSFDKFSASTRRGGEIIEAKVLRGAFLSVFASDWARQSAIRDYGVPPAVAHDIAWGANVDNVRGAARKLPAGELRFLFNGVDWKRKGGAIAVSTIAELTRRRIPARLDVIGRTDAVMRGAPTPANVTFHGFIGKTTETGASKFNRLYADATFFLLPTQAECFGISFAEAAHHGLPCIGTATGGVPAAVRHGVTGLLLPPGAPAAAYADAIMELTSSPPAYEAMSRAALADAAARLNWDTWAEKVATAVSHRLSGGA